jgi:Aromatic acid exporter family member 1
LGVPLTVEPLRRVAAVTEARLRQRGRSAVVWTLRLTAAAVASYVVAHAIFPNSQALLAPLTALLVVQLTPVSLLTSGAQRVISVVAGVLVAVGFSSEFGVSWWSLGLLIALSITIAQALRLGSSAMEVPISAMLVLGAGVGGAETAAWQRVSETLVGAGVGVLSNLLFPPRVATEDAGGAIQRFADDLARLLDAAADDLETALQRDGTLTDQTSRWLGEARRLTHEIPNVGIALLRAEESRRLNLRALGTTDVGPGLRHGLEALEHSAVAVRSMFRSLDDVGRSRESEPPDFRQDLQMVAIDLLLHELAAAVRAFGVLVHVEAQPTLSRLEPDELRQGVEGLNEARARLTDLLLIDRREDPTFAELNFALLATVERLLRELNLEDRLRHLEQRPPPGPRRIVTRPRRDPSDSEGSRQGLGIWPGRK